MFIEYLFKDSRFFFAMLIAVVVSVCLHELSHGLAAIWLGDRTSIEQGRLTLNPMVHMGLPALICLLVAGVAWGAMPVDGRRLRGRFAPALVAAAGPAMNVLIAAFTLGGLGLWMRFDPRGEDELSSFAGNGQYLLWIFGCANVLLALFNLLPIPPLDGSKILAGFSPSFRRTIDEIMRRSPGLMVPAIILAFVLAGKFITPAALNIAQKTLIAVRGW